MTQEEWAALDKKMDAYFRGQTAKAEREGQTFERPTCADCREPIEPWQTRTQLGDRFYHYDKCGPDPRAAIGEGNTG